MTNNKTDGERLERMEANLETLTKLVEAQGEAQKETNALLQDMKLHQAKQSGTLATIQYVDSKVDSVKKSTTTQRWVQNTLSAILGVVLSLLVAYFITHVGG